ncbi:hypothetical protein [Staphylococcus carnosus]|uniref:hypothetical protein n=1 Tax=Staphylococcus carnosus TaxID=1281 RepID=UPI0002F997B7|nr:hypothetical protein [Staphylococcus carnosus]ANZ32357.1 hypothetical protein BEK99_00085 [Staphylococcus carnosus]QPT02882.1 hypothetical protein I6G40_07035 [Staphylococcus carnosus]UQA67886.1 hypothetical protein Sta3580_03065 [Staphylococcus carnosus]UTB77291.1 hypothetical protein A2I62_01325 [Staphylococcus carnosus]UTB79716.1 hypothetical protein A2I65_01815 [Staphylococcus carnosus]
MDVLVDCDSDDASDALLDVLFEVLAAIEVLNEPEFELLNDVLVDVEVASDAAIDPLFELLND